MQRTINELIIDLNDLVEQRDWAYRAGHRATYHNLSDDIGAIETELKRRRALEQDRARTGAAGVV